MNELIKNIELYRDINIIDSDEFLVWGRSYVSQAKTMMT
eukprot:UN05525